MEITGKITYVSQVEEVGENKTPKCYICVEEVDKEYPKAAAIQFRGDKTDIVSMYRVGDIVTVGFRIAISEYEGKHYNNITGRKVKSHKRARPAAGSMDGDVDDDLPF